MTELRIVGLLSSLLGVAMLAFSTYGIIEARDFSRLLALWQKTQGVVLDSADFNFRWMVLVSVIGGAGIACIAGGVALMRRRHWGLLVISASAIGLAVYPWCLKALGATRYGFEVAEVLDTIALSAIAATAAAAYFWKADRVAA